MNDVGFDDVPIVVECEQGSPAWHAERCGRPTASEFGAILSGGPGRRTYMHRLAGERLTGFVDADAFHGNKNTKRGHAMEAEEVARYEILHNVEVVRGGIILKSGCGYSPDGRIGGNGLWEGKSKAPHILIDVLLNDEIPNEHKPQIYGGLWVSEREWLDFSAYYYGMPRFERRVYRDEKYIRALEAALRQFNEELDELCEKLNQIKEQG